MDEPFVSINLGSKWIEALFRRLKRIRLSRINEINQINNEVLFNDPLELAKQYVEPYCQEINPADRFDEDFFVSKEPVFKKINEFLGLNNNHPGNNQLFILSDAGMGKTSLLVMLKLLHITSFWPKYYQCKLYKLSPGILDVLEEIEDKRKIILLLDSLDEDSSAYPNVLTRLKEILKKTSSFKKVIITCRTQFFPMVEKDPLELPGRIRIGPYICPSKYLSIFDNNLIDKFLIKKYPNRFYFFVPKKIRHSAKTITIKMDSLRCRPMLLSYIDDLLHSPIVENSYSEFMIFKILVETWLLREEAKATIDASKLWRTCEQLAIYMQANSKVCISEEEIDEAIGKFAEIKDVRKIDITGHSLLNKNSHGNYRFSHYAIQEFLVAYYLINLKEIDPNLTVIATDLIMKFLEKNSDNPTALTHLNFKNVNHLLSLEIPSYFRKNLGHSEGEDSLKDKEVFNNEAKDITNDESEYTSKRNVITEFNENIGKSLFPSSKLKERVYVSKGSVITQYEDDLDVPTFLRKYMKDKDNDQL